MASTVPKLWFNHMFPVSCVLARIHNYEYIVIPALQIYMWISMSSASETPYICIIWVDMIMHCYSYLWYTCRAWGPIPSMVHLGNSGWKDPVGNGVPIGYSSHLNMFSNCELNLHLWITAWWLSIALQPLSESLLVVGFSVYNVRTAWRQDGQSLKCWTWTPQSQRLHHIQ
jgi:hypothetical protein